MFSAEIKAIEAHLPEKIVTNKDIVRMSNANITEDWIIKKLGIKERRFVSSEATSDLASKAALKLLKNNNISVNDIDMIIVVTSTPDMLIPSTASIVQGKIGARKDICCFDVMNSCSGFNYGLSVAVRFAENNKNVLLIAAETYSKYLDRSDKSFAIFGDGAAATLVTKSNREKYLYERFWCDGRKSNVIEIPICGKFRMKGREVKDFILTVVVKEVEEALKDVKLDKNDVKFIFHQANVRVLEKLIEKLGIKEDQTHITVDKYGNLAAASIPVTLYDAIKEGKIKKGDLVMLVGFGAGLSVGINLIEV